MRQSGYWKAVRPSILFGSLPEGSIKEIQAARIVLTKWTIFKGNEVEA
jgi:hypothetical protein